MTTQRVRVSVIVPLYNNPEQAAECLGAIGAPREPGLEVIAVDDGSTDETEEICSRYEGRIRVIRRDTKGFGPSLTDAFRLSSGDWVAPLDADDWFHASKLRTCADAITDDRPPDWQ